MTFKKIFFTVTFLLAVMVNALTLASCSFNAGCNQAEALEKDVKSIKSADAGANIKISIANGLVPVPAYYEKTEPPSGETIFRRVVSGNQPICGPSLSEIVVSDSKCKECDRNSMVSFGALVSEDEISVHGEIVELLLWKEFQHSNSEVPPLYIQVISSKSIQRAVIVIDTRLEFVETVKSEFVGSLKAKTHTDG